MGTSGHSVTNKVYVDNGVIGNISAYSAEYSNAIVGRYVFKYGYKTGLTLGTIKSIHASVYEWIYDITIYGLVLTESALGGDMVGHGDSGGPVWWLNGSNQRVFMGIVTARGDSTYREMKYTPYWQFNAFTPKTN